MPSFDRVPSAPSHCYPPPTTVSSESRSSHSVTPQAGGGGGYHPNNNLMSTTTTTTTSSTSGPFAGYHMPQSAGYPGGGGGDKQQQQQFPGWHGYPPPYGAYGAAYPYPPTDASAMMQQGYPPMSHPTRSTTPIKKEDTSSSGSAPSANNTTSSTTQSNTTTKPREPSPSSDRGQQEEQQQQQQELTEVKPIQTDFHFFVKDFMHKLRAAAEAEVDASLLGKSEDYIAQNRQLLVYSNLNCRLMKRWEIMSQDDREEYFQKEETDRKRFMEEDEVASRHCFTLTARQRSPTGGVVADGAAGVKRPSSTSPEEPLHKKIMSASPPPPPESFFVNS